MRHIEGRFEGTGGLELYYQQWLPDGSPRLVVVLVHGVGEHSGRYLNVVRPLAEAGYAACAYDHRGHGLSPGPRVHIDAWSEYREDLTTYIALVAQQWPGLPRVLYGHSRGSLVVLDFHLCPVSSGDNDSIPNSDAADKENAYDRPGFSLSAGTST